MQTRARRRRRSSSTNSARAAIGVRQEPSSTARQARSAATRVAERGSSRAATRARVAASSLRISRPMAPWATAGSISSGESSAVTRSTMPSRRSPAMASSVASTCPSSSLRSRVCTLPRSGKTSRSGRSSSTCAWRRREAVPTTLPAGRPARLSPRRAKSASRGSSRGRIAARLRPSGSQVGTSFMEWTATSMRPANSASSISLVKRPLPPISARVRSCTRSPVVLMTTISMAPSAASSPCACARRSRTSCAWASASALPRVPRRITADMTGLRSWRKLYGLSGGVARPRPRRTRPVPGRCHPDPGVRPLGVRPGCAAMMVVKSECAA